jgi:hypothetical protein
MAAEEFPDHTDIDLSEAVIMSEEELIRLQANITWTD